jgi:putative FmdB family regulatory protein
MPTYEYVCVDCANRFEVFQRIGDASPSLCDVCGGALRKVFHPIGVVLKGSGFYKTEARSASKEASSKKEQATKKASEPAPSGEKHEKSA